MRRSSPGHSTTRWLLTQSFREARLNVEAGGVHDGVQLDVLGAGGDAGLGDPQDGVGDEAAVVSGEERHEVGGYFILNGIERIIRLLIQQRQHYIM